MPTTPTTRAVGRDRWDVPDLDSIDATLTRTGRWWITYPCGGHSDLAVKADTKEVRVVIRQHIQGCPRCSITRPKIPGRLTRD